MKINENQKIIGDRVVLVPYCWHHVVKYHEWMSSAEIRELTASEPLSMEEEYEMQAKWQQDADKLTFIVLRKDKYLSDGNDEEAEIQTMVGDVNCFLIDEDDQDEAIESPSEHKQAELEVMIVDKANRGCGFGSEAVYLMIQYCYQHLDQLNVNKFVVKIGEENAASIRMFERLGFVNFKYIKPFKQVCLKLELDVFENAGQEAGLSQPFKFSKNCQLNIQPYKSSNLNK